MVDLESMRTADPLKISVLTATRNRAATFLRECIRSVQNQYGDVEYEHIIIDDASTDNTWGFLEGEAEQDSRIIPVFSPENRRAAHALNLGLARATGEFVLPLDDDDLLLPHSIQQHTDFLLQNPDVEFSFGRTVLIDENSRLSLWGNKIDFNKTEYSDDNETFYRMLLETCWVTNGTAVVAKQAVEDVGGWDESFHTQDYEMWLKLIYHRKVHKRNDRYLSCYRIHEEQLTTAHSEDGTWKLEGERLKNLYGNRAT